MLLLANTKLNTIEILISKAFIDSNISHDEFVLVNNVLKEYDDMEEDIKNFNKYVQYNQTNITYFISA